jgi:hypothetical protein
MIACGGSFVLRHKFGKSADLGTTDSDLVIVAAMGLDFAAKSTMPGTEWRKPAIEPEPDQEDESDERTSGGGVAPRLMTFYPGLYRRGKNLVVC